MRTPIHPFHTGLALAAVLASSAAAAQTGDQPAPHRVEVGGRYYQHWAGKHTLVGDMQGHGGYVGVRLSRRWSLQAGFDQLHYDLEVPILVTGIRPNDPKPVDTFVEVRRVRADVVAHLGRGGKWDPYLSAGIAHHTTESTEADGVTAEGGPYHVHVATPRTVGVNVAAGANLSLGRGLSGGLGFAYGQTLEGYTVTDRVSGRQGDVRALSPLGITAQFAIRF
jgi:Outer membrane protein beta-barrel domain